MLRFLNIVNLAVIESLQVELRGGLNVLSGETGSGKSIIIDALGLLLGERSSAEMIRTGSDRAFVEGIFEAAGNSPLLELLGRAGIEADEDGLVVRREISASGRGRIFVNNRVATLALLREMQPHLIDLHGQGDQQSLLRAEAHLNLMDAFAGTDELLDQVSREYEDLGRALREFESSRQTESERLQNLDLLDFQINEIEQARLQDNEDKTLEAEHIMLANAEKLAGLCDEAYNNISEDEYSALNRIGAVERRMTDLAELDPGFSPYLDQLRSARHILDDLAFFLRDYAEGIQVSPDRLKYVEDRLAEIERLKRKYGRTLDEVLASLESMTGRREGLLQSEQRAQNLEKELKSALDSYRAAAEKLTERRRAAARKFEKAIARELGDVALETARFKIDFSRPSPTALTDKLRESAEWTGGGLRRTGLDAVEFFFTANPGEDLKPMSAVASGGELSRLMLVLKTITAPSLFPRTLIFDEIDAGIGGKVADAVGLRLHRLAETNQVLCVTHQSQIARYADAHFQVSKEVVDGRTVTRVLELDKVGRIEELARMIGGAEITPLARKHARELLRTG